ncbi:MAG: hypothetical protein QME64_01300 [bacterium]|nr:hypothetical protein [bacterium]
MLEHRIRIFIILIFFMLVSALLVSCMQERSTEFSQVTPPNSGTTTATAGDAVAQIQVDCAKVRGELSPYIFGTLAGPGASFNEYAVKLTKEAGFKLVAVMVREPLPSLKNDVIPAKAGNEQNLAVAELTRALGYIHQIEAEPLIDCSVTRKPENIEQFAESVRVFAREMKENIEKTSSLRKQGKNGLPLRVWRFGNEPDFGTRYWRGTTQEWCETYAAWAQALKSVDPQFIVGGFSLGAALRDVHNVPSRPTQLRTSFGPFAQEALDYCRKNQVPVDWFGFHAYNAVTYEDFYQQAKIVFAELKKYSGLSPLFGSPKMACDEWNIKLGDAWSGKYDSIFDSVNVAAHNIMALNEMVEQGLWLSIRFGGTANAPVVENAKNMADHAAFQIQGDLTNGHDFPLVDGNGNRKPVYYAFKGFNMLAKTPFLLATEGGDRLNLAVCAGKDKNNTTVIIVLSNYDVEQTLDIIEQPAFRKTIDREVLAQAKQTLGVERIPRYRKFKITVNNLPWPSEGIWERYAVDANHTLTNVAIGTTQHTQLVLEGTMDCPSVQVWVVKTKGR